MKLILYNNFSESNKVDKNISKIIELAIHRQRDTKPTEFATYNSYCEECKATAKRILKMD